MLSWAEHIEDLLSISVKGLKRVGVFPDNCRGKDYTAEGRLNLFWGDRPAGAFYLYVDIARQYTSIARFEWTEQDENRSEIITLVWRPSNLGVGGFWLFQCPITGRTCRKLYFYGGRLISRHAIPLIYEAQGESHSRREHWTAYCMKINKNEKIVFEPGRKWYYRGKMTRYGLKAKRAAEKMQILYPLLTQKVDEESRRIDERQAKRHAPKIADINTIFE